MVGPIGEKFRNAPCPRTDIEQTPERLPAETVQQRGFHRLGWAQPRTQLVPFPRVTCEVVCRAFLPMSTDQGQLPTIFLAMRVEGHVLFLGRLKQMVDRSSEAITRTVRSRLAQEYPTAFAPPLGEPTVAQYPYVAGHPRLALDQDLRQFTHCKFHMRDQPHDPEPRRIRKRFGYCFNQHTR